jgi:hypothetical protein
MGQAFFKFRLRVRLMRVSRSNSSERRFHRLNSPILACSTFKSTGASAALALS